MTKEDTFDVEIRCNPSMSYFLISSNLADTPFNYEYQIRKKGTKRKLIFMVCLCFKMY